MLTSLIPFRRLDDLFNDMCEPACRTDADSTMFAQVLPRADILEGDKEYRIVMDLPGVDRDGLSVELQDQTLIVSAKREEPLPEGFKALRGERAGRVEFHRTFSLGRGIDAAGISARIERGLLTVTLPKTEQVLPRKIEIK